MAMATWIRLRFKTAFWNENDLCPGERFSPITETTCMRPKCISHDCSLTLGMCAGRNRKQLGYSALCCLVADCPSNSLPAAHGTVVALWNAEFTCTTLASKDNKVSRAWDWISMLHSPLVVDTDAVCFSSGKGWHDRSVMNQERTRRYGEDPHTRSERAFVSPLRKKTLYLFEVCAKTFSDKLKQRLQNSPWLKLPLDTRQKSCVLKRHSVWT